MKIIAKIPEIFKEEAQTIPSSLNQREKGKKNPSSRKISIMQSNA